jgi:hypothetical protein
MTYAEFKQLIALNGWTVRALRCDDAPPTPAMYEVMDIIGLAKYERFVLRYQREQSK